MTIALHGSGEPLNPGRGGDVLIGPRTTVDGAVVVTATVTEAGFVPSMGSEFGDTLQVASVGAPEQVIEMVLAKPPCGDTVNA